MRLVYLIVLALSAALGAGGLMRLQHRVAKLFSLSDGSTGFLIMMPLIAFLVVVAMPAGALLGAILLLGFAARALSRPFTPRNYHVIFLAASLLGLMGLPAPVLAHHTLAVLALLLIWMGWFAFALSEVYIARALDMLALHVILATAPLIFAPLATSAPAAIAVDLTILDAAMLGVLLVVKPEETAVVTLRWPLTFLIGYLEARTLVGGGWLYVLASCGIWAWFWPVRPTFPRKLIHARPA